MKIKFLLLLLGSISFWACTPEKDPISPAPTPVPVKPAEPVICKQRFFYDADGKKNFPSVADSLVFIGFNTTTPAATASVLASFNFLKPVAPAAINNQTTLLVKFVPSTSCQTYETRLKTLLENPAIDFVSPVFEGGAWSYTTEFMVKLKDPTQLQTLQQLAGNQKCQIKEALSADTFILTVSKASGLDAMEMAARFYETSHFDWTEVNGYVF